MSDKAPPPFHAKLEHLKTVIDPASNRSIADLLGNPRDFIVHKSGAHLQYTDNGGIYSFDHTGRFPLCALYGPIYYLHKKLGQLDSGYGRPITDVTDLADGSKCCIFEGGHIHSLGDKAEPFPVEHCIAPYKPQAPLNPFGVRPGGMPPLFHQRWMELSTLRHPSGEMIIQILGGPREVHENPCGGQMFLFWGGCLVSLNETSLPYVMYGDIWYKWKKMGGVDSGWGRPLADEQPLNDGSNGRCSITEGGHIHSVGALTRGAPAETCTAQYQPKGRAQIWNKMPPYFQRKWEKLSLLIHPIEQISVAEVLSYPQAGLNNNPNKTGQYFDFVGGWLVSLDMNPNPGPVITVQTPQPQPISPPFSGMGTSYPPSSPHSPYGTPPPMGASGAQIPGTPQPYHVSAQSPGFGVPSTYDSPHPRSPPTTHSRTSSYGFPQPGAAGPRGSFNQPAVAGGSAPLELIPPFYVQGAIFYFWKKQNHIEGTFGRPLCDEQDLGDGGRCAIFEGGHIHLYNGVAKGVSPEGCTAPYQPRNPPPPYAGISPQANYSTPNNNGQLGTHHQPNYHYQPNYPATPAPNIYGAGANGQGQSQQAQQKEGSSSACVSCWKCFTGIDMDKGPEEIGPLMCYAISGLQPGQHDGWCCHGCIHVRAS